MNDKTDKPRLHLVPRDGEPLTTTPAISVTRNFTTCFPHRILIDEKARTVKCEVCGKEFTPFDGLLYISREWSRYSTNLNALKKECQQLADERTDLRKQIKNLRATKKRAER